ncbi:MAG: hypothetical protein II820_02400 [Ruminiclostridium sp.]|nr:hypothetical protein [Ruminiclostridium sp.]
MSLKNKTFQIILRIICGLFFVLAIFLSVTAVVYSLGDGTPNIFGSNIYLVKTDAFGFLTDGTALISKQVPPSEIQRTNIVIFNLENGKPALAQVLDSELADGVYSFRVLTENNAEITLTQSQVVAKGMSYSDILGTLIRFAVSPFGMMIVAIVPCIIIIILEIVKFAGKIMPQPEIETIKKQYEVPTYIPNADKPQRERRGRAEAAKAYRTASLDNSIGIYDTGISETTRSKSGQQDIRNDYADIAARQQQSPLFTNPTRKPQQKPVSKSTMPLSAKKLNEAIEATKAEHELDDMRKKREQVVKDIQKTRGAAIAAEKALETGERQVSAEAGRTSKLAKTTVIGELSRERTSEFTEAAARTIAAQEERRKQTAAIPQPQPAQPKKQRPALRLNQEEPARRYDTNRRSTNTTTSIPRLDSLLSEENDSDTRYNIDEILAGLDNNHR